MTRSRIDTLLFGAGCFLLPVIIFCVGAATADVYPFGSHSFVEDDMRFQYVDYFAWYRDVLMGSADPFYSTAQGLGGSTLALWGYYLASPFNLLLPAFGEQDIAIFCFIITLLKAGCIQLATVFYLCRRFSLGRAWACTLALGFSLSIWTVTQLRNPMWLDALILLPLCAWGVCCLLRQERWRMLAVTYGLCVLTNWYMGYMVGIFLCLYAVFEGYALGFEGVRSWGLVHRKRLFQFCGCLILGLALAAIAFLPSVIALSSNGATIDAEGEFAAIEALIAKRLPFLASIPFEAILGVAALVFLVVLIAILFGFRRWSVRRKATVALFAALVILLLMSVVVPALQHGTFPDVARALLWGGWQDQATPQLFGSFLILVGAGAFFCLRTVPRKLKLAAGLFLFLLLLSCWLYPLTFIWGGFRLPSGHHSRVGFLFIFMLLWCAAAALRALQRSSTSKAWHFLSLTGVQAGALAASVIGAAVRVALIWPSIFWITPYQLLEDYNETALAQVAELEEQDPGIYRVEKTYWKLGYPSLNEGMTLGVDQLASYTSTTDGSVIAFLSALGCGNGEFLTYEAANPGLVADSLLGVKYVSATDVPFGYEDAGFAPISVEGPGYSLEEARFYENPYALALAYGASDDVTAFQMPNGSRWECANALARAIWGQERDLYLGTSTEEDPTLDMSAFTQMVDELKQHEFTFDEFGGSRISGTVDAAEGQMLLMTIPNQDGWRVWVDGTQVTPQDAGDGALMAIPVHAGENRVEMQFTTPGLAAGAVVTLLALLFIVAVPRLRMMCAHKGDARTYEG